MTLDLLRILYRGPLASCNYDCAYCPFGKARSTRAELAADREVLERFVGWAAEQSRQLSVLFTPWGEGLIRRHYQDAMITLSHLPNVERVAMQTNLSWKPAWLDRANLDRLALWTTFHPTECSLETYVSRCAALHERGVRFSVGIVGLKEHRVLAEALRAALPSDVYLWVNAYKSSGPGYYSADDVALFTGIDSLFPVNNERHASEGDRCQTGESVISVDGMGDVRRCHFVKEVLGNLYRDDLRDMLRPRVCPNPTCGCHIGYVHLERLRLRARFGKGLMERIPEVKDGGRPRRESRMSEEDLCARLRMAAEAHALPPSREGIGAAAIRQHLGALEAMVATELEKQWMLGSAIAMTRTTTRITTTRSLSSGPDGEAELRKSDGAI